MCTHYKTNLGDATVKGRFYRDTSVGKCTQVVSTDAPIEIRQAAAVNFKNFVKYSWVSVLNSTLHDALAGTYQNI
jgi:hypothetical protein